MKADQVVNAVVGSFNSIFPSTMEEALGVGLELLMGEYAPKLSGAVPTRELSLLREMFTLWKAVTAKLVQHEKWPDNMPGYRDRATSYVLNAFPIFLEVNNPKHFLLMLDNNAFLGWKPEPAQQARIEQLRWHHKKEYMPNRGLATSHARAYVAQAAPRAQGRR